MPPSGLKAGTSDMYFFPMYNPRRDFKQKFKAMFLESVGLEVNQPTTSKRSIVGIQVLYQLLTDF